MSIILATCKWLWNRFCYLQENYKMCLEANSSWCFFTLCSSLQRLARIWLRINKASFNSLRKWSHMPCVARDYGSCKAILKGMGRIERRNREIHIIHNTHKCVRTKSNQYTEQVFLHWTGLFIFISNEIKMEKANNFLYPCTTQIVAIVWFRKLLF